MKRLFILAQSVAFVLLIASQLLSQSWSLSQNPELEEYFEDKVAEIEKANELTQYKTIESWQNERPKLRKQLFDMLGLDPLPERSPLRPKITGTTEHAEFVVERLHFQAMPGLYVTANLYLPRPATNEDEGQSETKTETKSYPTILYVCGHAKVKKDGVSYGNKAHYQHHGSWFARNGYVCLIIDTVQRGEIEGAHHGTYRLNRWWWNSRGYTPAGMEAWNCIRALDYLETRKECDMSRVGVTGRSGGGIYSWWLMALDDRVHCAVPVAGITSMRDQITRGCIEGHCDCMFMLNTYQWNFAKVAALAAPRPLLISNTDKDVIFPLEGVVDVHRQVRHIYRLHDAGDQLGLQITEGPHADTQELHIHAFRWFNRFLKGDQTPIETTAEKFFTPELLKVFDRLPTDELNTRIDEEFVPGAKLPTVDSILNQQETLLSDYQQLLLQRCFRAWPSEIESRRTTQAIDLSNGSNTDANDVRVTLLTFNSEPHVQLRVAIKHSAEVPLRDIRSLNLHVDSNPSSLEISPTPGTAVAHLVVRPGTSPWIADDRKMTHIRRRFQLLGTTVESMQVWDIRCGIRALRKECPNVQKLTIASGDGANSLVLLASLFEPEIDQIAVKDLASTERDLPSILNLSRTMPVELLPILVAKKSRIVVHAPLSVAAQQRLRVIDEVVNDPKWTGKSIEFSVAR